MPHGKLRFNYSRFARRKSENYIYLLHFFSPSDLFVFDLDVKTQLTKFKDRNISAKLLYYDISSEKKLPRDFSFIFFLLFSSNSHNIFITR